MGLDVEVPDAPQLSNRGLPSEFEAVEAVGGAEDLRREELEAVLRDGAWQEAFREWAAYTDLTAEEFRVALDLGLVERLDVFWDPMEERLRSSAPPVPEDWRERTDRPVSDAEALAARLEAELADLGDAVVEMLEDAYVAWGDEEATDPVWGEETFGHGVRE